MSILRTWCARCQFPGKTEFLFGTVTTLRNEGEEVARRAIATELTKVLPTMPEILALLPGMLVFLPEEPDQS